MCLTLSQEQAMLTGSPTVAGAAHKELVCILTQCPPPQRALL